MQSEKESHAIINRPYGTDAYHKYSKIPWFPLATDGVIELAEAAECFWLLDLIGSYQTNKELDPQFQVWKLKVNQEPINKKSSPK